MPEFHFINDPDVMAVIDEILSLVGPNFTAPYDSESQPSDGVERNEEELTQYDVPGGTTLKSTQNTQTNPSMGFVISSLLTVLSPVISAYGFLLPILGIIKAIIEILCCLMNPFCVIPAVIRLFKKYLPPFISLFPPAAGAIIIKSTIKLILALVYYIMTEIVPTIQLIIDNVGKIVEAFSATPRNEAKADAGKQKILAIITDLANRIGLLAVLKPLLEIIFLILQLIAGIPCDSGSSSSRSMPILGAFGPFDLNLLDTPCCNDTQCPPELADPAQGMGIMLDSFYGDSIPKWTWQVVPITGGEKIPPLKQYMQDLKSQLDPQLDEEVKVVPPIGSQYDASTLRVRIMGRRNQPICKEHAGQENANIFEASFPVTEIYDNGSFKFRGWPGLELLRGVVNYCFEPNFMQLAANNTIAVSCHPDVIQAKAEVAEQFSDIMEQSVLDRFPELRDLPTRYDDFTGKMNLGPQKIREVVDKPLEGFTLDDQDTIQAIQDDMLEELFDYSNELNDLLNVMVSRMSDKVISSLSVDKNIVRAGNADKAVIQVIPYDVTGTPLMKNMREDVTLDVQIFSDFGTIENQRFDSSTGATLADLVSLLPGTANITAKVNKEFIQTAYGEDGTLQVEQVRFVTDDILPKRRRRK